MSILLASWAPGLYENAGIVVGEYAKTHQADMVDTLPWTARGCKSQALLCKKLRELLLGRWFQGLAFKKHLEKEIPAVSKGSHRLYDYTQQIPAVCR